MAFPILLNSELSHYLLRPLINLEIFNENKFWKFISRNTKFSENLVQLDKRLLQNYYKSLGYYDVNIVSNSAELKKEGVEIPVVVGGIIPEEDRPILLASGVTAVYTPKDFKLSQIMRDIAEIAARNRK